jgi:urea transport system permease protein
MAIGQNYRRIWPGLLVMLALLGGIGAAWPAWADADGAFGKIASDSFAQIETGITELVASGAPTAADALQALSDGRLFFAPDRTTLVIKSATGAAFDARTGQALTDPPGGLKQVRLNNRVRRALEAALGSLTLLAPDPAKRRSAAEAVFKSRDLAALPALDAALAREQQSDIKAVMLVARAAIVVANPDAPEADRIGALDVLATRGDQDVLGLLNTVKVSAPVNLKTAIDAAIAAVERHMSMLAAVQNLVYGLSLGSVLLLAAIGLAITFGVMGIINMAHGEMIMLGAYTTFVVQETIRTRIPGLFDWSLLIAVPLAFIVAGAVGLLIERTVIRWLYGRPLETLLATWGVSLILQQTVRSIFGANNREVGAPSFMSGSVDVLGVSVTYGRMWIIVFSLVVFATLFIVLRATSFGLKMRAVTQNRRMAAAMGIRTPWVDALTFALGSGIAGIAGVALSQIDNVSPNLGQSYIIDSFMVVVFGGVGNLWGTLLGALTLGVANKLLEPFAGAVLGKILVLVCIILFIQKRPRGLFALKGRAVEA